LRKLPFVPDTAEAKKLGFVPIRFSCRERADEIEEQAYRRGFPCHQSADYVESDDADLQEHDGFYFGEHTSHCAGALLMYADAGGNVPLQQEEEDLQDKVLAELDWRTPHFDNETDFLDSYGPEVDEEE